MYLKGYYIVFALYLHTRSTYCLLHYTTSNGLILKTVTFRFLISFFWPYRISCLETYWGSSRTVMAGRSSGWSLPTSACSFTNLIRWSTQTKLTPRFLHSLFGSVKSILTTSPQLSVEFETSVYKIYCIHVFFFFRMIIHWPVFLCWDTQWPFLLNLKTFTRTMYSNCILNPMSTTSDQRVNTLLRGIWYIMHSQFIYIGLWKWQLG